MKNYGFEIKLNDQLLCRAGFEEENGVLTCILDTLRRAGEAPGELHLHVGGMDTDKQSHVGWVEQNLAMGDRLSIEIVDAPFDPPTTVRMRDSEAVTLAKKIEYFHQLQQELKDYL